MSELEELFTEEAPSLIGVGADALVENATRLGLTWVLRFGTVQTDDPLTVIVDGDTVPVSMVSLTGYLEVGARVSVLIVSSKVHFVIGPLAAEPPDPVTDSSPGTVAANFTGSGLARTLADGNLVYVSLTLVTTNAIPESGGNIPDTTCYTLNAAYRPSEAVYTAFGSGVYFGLATINTNGTVVLRAANVSIGAGDSCNMNTTFIKAA